MIDMIEKTLNRKVYFGRQLRRCRLFHSPSYHLMSPKASFQMKLPPNQRSFAPRWTQALNIGLNTSSFILPHARLDLTDPVASTGSYTDKKRRMRNTWRGWIVLVWKTIFSCNYIIRNILFGMLISYTKVFRRSSACTRPGNGSCRVTVTAAVENRKIKLFVISDFLIHVLFLFLIYHKV